MALEWLDETNAVLNGIKVRCANSDYRNQKTTDDEIVVLKPRKFFDEYQKT